MSYKVYIPEDVPASGKDYLKARGYEVVVGTGYRPETIRQEIADADALIVRMAPYPKDVIRSGKNLKVIARHGIGFDNIDIEAAEEMGIYVAISRNVHSSYAVAEHALTMMMMLAKRMPVLNACIGQGNWNIRKGILTSELQGKTLGLIGCGAIGQKLAKMAHCGLEMDVVGYDAYIDYANLPDIITGVNTLDELYARADYISLHVPFTEGTRNMINRASLAKMKPAACVINCARGGIVDEDALYDALVNGVIRGAGCDCFAVEPFNPDHKLFTLPNFVSSPHNAGMSQEAQDATGIASAEAIDAVLNGRAPQFPVNNPKFMRGR